MSAHDGMIRENGVVTMILHCWRDGRLGIERELPAGAIELARGGRASLRGILLLARDATQPKGVDRLPGTTLALSDAAMVDLLRKQMHRLEGLGGSGVVFNKHLEMRFIGQE